MKRSKEVVDDPMGVVEQPSAAKAVADTLAAERSFLDRPVLAGLPINREVLIFAGIVILAGVLRFWDLGSRILHHDESIHAVYSWYLLTGRGYVHNPTYHGPFLYHATAFLYLLFGAADYTVRMAPAIFGTVMVGLPYLLRRHLGRHGALASALLLAVSPSILYYSRSLRHDVFAATATLTLVVALWRYADDRRPRWLYLSAGALALGFTNHELTFITVFELVLFLLPFAVWPRWMDATRATAGRPCGSRAQQDNYAPQPIWTAIRAGNPRLMSPWADMLVLIGTLAVPLFTAAILLIPGVGGPSSSWPAPDKPDGLLLFTLGTLFIAAAAIGLWWNSGTWTRAALIFWVPCALLYTAFLSNPQGFLSGTIGSLLYWLTQQDVQRGGQPWFYYLLLLPLYEFLPLLFGLGGVIYAIRRRNLFGLMLGYWAFLSLVLYSRAGEKMPWLVIHIAIPFVLLAGLAIGKLIERIDWRAAWARGGGFLSLWYFLALVVLVALWNLGSPFSSSLAVSTRDGQATFFRWLLLLALLGVTAVLAARRARAFGRGAITLLGCVVVIAGLLPLTVRASIEANFYHSDIPVEMLVYTQSSPDVGKVMREIERVGFRTGAGMDLKVAYDDEVSWPFEWYLRDYKSRNYFGNGLPAADAPIVLVGLDNNHDARLRPVLGNNYVGQRYKLRWWFPEDYRGISPENLPPLPFEPPVLREQFRQGLAFLNSIRWFLFDPTTRGKIWRYFLYRATLNPLGSTDFMLYERRELVSGTFSATATTGPVAPQEDEYASRTRDIAASQTFGSAGSGPGQLAEPKNLALTPDGSTYVLDSKNNRVEKFDAGGRFLAQFGSAGRGEGQFSEPWGIAVSPDGMLYVADTWNHRIEKFDPDGKFLGQWGRYGSTAEGSAAPGDFFGPRGIAVDAAGNLYVTDAGNHRVQKFDKDGRFLAVFGTRGGGEGQFNEPVGIAIDQAGMIYIADTWNRRVDKFDPSFKPVAQWPIAGWQSDSPNNKPYIAVDLSGSVYVTDPENNRVVKLNSDGKVATVWGKFGSDTTSLRMPTGIAVGPKGGPIVVADSQNNRIVKFPPVP